MQLKNLTGTEKAALHSFVQWISTMPSGRLNHITADMFAADTGTPPEDAVRLFGLLVRRRIAAPIIKLACPGCGEECLLDSPGGTAVCGNCEHPLQAEIGSAKSFSYRVDKAAAYSLFQPESEKDFIAEAFYLDNPDNGENACKKEDPAMPQAYTQTATSAASMWDMKKTEKPADSVDIAIITALAEELEPVKQLLTNPRKENAGPHTFLRGQFTEGGRTIEVAAAHASMMGMVASCLLTAELIDTFSPRCVAMAGIAAATDQGKHLYGDILCASQAWDYTSGKIIRAPDGSRQFEPAPAPIPLSPGIHNLISQFMEDSAVFHDVKKRFAVTGQTPPTELRLHLGPMASGGSVVANKEIVGQVRGQQRKLIGIDMETYGVYYAATYHHINSPLFFSMKSVVDYADEQKSDDYHKYACYTSANAIAQFCARYL